MSKSPSRPLFDRIAPVYGLFFEYQKKQFQRLFASHRDLLDKERTILDVGCGTGALCSVLADQGFSVTGIDPAPNMLRVAGKKTAHQGIPLLEASVLDGLPFEDRSFDVAIASFVAHGLKEKERMVMYGEMARVARHFVLLLDYSQNRYALVSFVEWLEKGDYFNFIKAPAEELRSCSHRGQACFSEVKVRDIGKWSACYVGRLPR